jgi:hypothetical protein
MDEIRLFLKKIAKNNYKLSIAYKEDYNLYKYKFDNFTLLFKEHEGEVLSLKYNDKTYKDKYEIHLVLFDIFDYKNMEYIDTYLLKKDIIIEDIYNDFYDDINKEFISIRNITKGDNIFKLKFIVYNNTDYKLFYNLKTISGFEEIISEIDDIFH